VPIFKIAIYLPRFGVLFINIWRLKYISSIYCTVYSYSLYFVDRICCTLSVGHLKMSSFKKLRKFMQVQPIINILNGFRLEHPNRLLPDILRIFYDLDVIRKVATRHFISNTGQTYSVSTRSGVCIILLTQAPPSFILFRRLLFLAVNNCRCRG